MHTTRLLRTSLLTFVVGIGCAEAPAPRIPPQATAIPPPAPKNSVAQAIASTPEKEAPLPPSPEAAPSSAAFTWKAYTALRGTSENYVFSGTSLRLALAMAAAGARGVTKTEMTNVLGAGAENELERPHQTSPNDRTTLRIANRLWADESVKMRAEYADAVKAQFGADVQILPMRADGEAARGKINTWVKDETAGKIIDLLPKGSIQAASRLVVTNAVYFKASWQSPFAVSATKEAPFTDDAGKKTKVPTMHRDGVLRAAELPDAKLVELDYKDSDFVMTLLVPNETNGLPKAEAALSAGTFETSLGALKLQRVSLSLPRFKLRAGGNVSSALQKLGIHAAFSRTQADFSGMLQAGAEPLMLDSVFHDAFVAVDEHGTEAAAATALVMSVLGMPLGKPLEIKADHPFLFAIRNRKSGQVLFLGRVGRPSA